MDPRESQPADSRRHRRKIAGVIWSVVFIYSFGYSLDGEIPQFLFFSLPGEQKREEKKKGGTLVIV